MRTQFVVTIAVALTACSQPSPPSPDASTSETAGFEATLSSSNQLLLSDASPIRIAQGDSGLVLTGHVPNANSQFETDGAALALGEANEQAFASRTVRVTIRARGVGATAFSAAYSTNDNGNSGWRELPLTTTVADVSFDYQVPAIVRGADDFIGIMPPPTGSVEVHSVKVEVIQ